MFFSLLHPSCPSGHMKELSLRSRPIPCLAFFHLYQHITISHKWCPSKIGTNPPPAPRILVFSTVLQDYNTECSVCSIIPPKPWTLVFPTGLQNYKVECSVFSIIVWEPGQLEFRTYRLYSQLNTKQLMTCYAGSLFGFVLLGSLPFMAIQCCSCSSSLALHYVVLYTKKNCMDVKCLKTLQTT